MSKYDNVSAIFGEQKIPLKSLSADDIRHATWRLLDHARMMMEWAHGYAPFISFLSRNTLVEKAAAKDPVAQKTLQVGNMSHLWLGVENPEGTRFPEQSGLSDSSECIYVCSSFCEKRDQKSYPKTYSTLVYFRTAGWHKWTTIVDASNAKKPEDVKYFLKESEVVPLNHVSIAELLVTNPNELHHLANTLHIIALHSASTYTKHVEMAGKLATDFQAAASRME